MKKTLLLIFIIIILPCLAFYCFIMYKQKREEIEHLIWKARIELEPLCNDRTVQYLSMHDLSCESNQLRINFLYEPLSSFEDKYKNEDDDKFKYAELMSIINLRPDKWKAASEYLLKANANVSFTFSSSIERTINITSQQFKEILSDKQLHEIGEEIFLIRKKMETLEYARFHFARDKYFDVDSLSIDEKFVTLHLSHDDSKAQLGHSFLDTTRVALHFTDKVGRMGSILDNMLSICAKTKKGFAFSYYGNKSHKVQRCEWNAEKAMKMHEETADKKWLDNRKTNRVRTVITRTKK
ncbi:MAG: hypothetical protein IIV53_05240 [Bacteroidaceae bacterium]|nr:hypothetical protein [Bacteroidaceae bacterium]